MDPKLIVSKSTDNFNVICNDNTLTLQKNDLESFNYGKNAPPGYTKATDSINPPSSSTLFKSVKYAKDSTNGSIRILKQIAKFFLYSVTITVILAILMAVPVVMIVVGSIFINDCPMQKMIPVWLIVFGALSIVKNLSTLIQRIKFLRNRKEERSTSTLLNVFDSFMALFLIIWFVCGNIWVYSNYKIVQYGAANLTDTYCNSLPFLLSFWIITSIYILIGLACFLFCCTICFTIFIPTKQ